MSRRTEIAYKAEPQGDLPDFATITGVVALHVVMHEVIGQKSADGIVVDSIFSDEVKA